MENMSKTQLQTRENFINAFEHVRKDKNLHSMSIRDITYAAGYNRSSFYLYFRDIYDLSEAAEDRLIDEIRNESQEMLLNPENGSAAYFIDKLASSAFNRADRILLFADQDSFQNKMLSLIRPVFCRITGFSQGSDDFDFFTSLILSTMLHNLKYYRAHPDESFSHLTDLSHKLIEPGLNKLSENNM